MKRSEPRPSRSTGGAHAHMVSCSVSPRTLEGAQPSTVRPSATWNPSRRLTPAVPAALGGGRQECGAEPVANAPPLFVHLIVRCTKFLTRPAAGSYRWHARAPDGTIADHACAAAPRRRSGSPACRHAGDADGRGGNAPFAPTARADADGRADEDRRRPLYAELFSRYRRSASRRFPSRSTCWCAATGWNAGWTNTIAGKPWSASPRKAAASCHIKQRAERHVAERLAPLSPTQRVELVAHVADASTTALRRLTPSVRGHQGNRPARSTVA